MIPGLNKTRAVCHDNMPQEAANVDVTDAKFSYSTMDLKILQFTQIPQFTKEEDFKIIAFGNEKQPKTTLDWETLSKSLGKPAIAIRFRYHGPLGQY